MNESFSWFVGIDGGYDAHHICLVDAGGVWLESRPVDHDAPAVHAWIAWLLARTDAAPAQIAVAIETPRGALVTTLLERGFAGLC